MKTILVALFFSSVWMLRADSLICPPSFVTDSVSVNPSCPGLGAVVIADPGSNWLLAWNDNPRNTGPNVDGDYDFNDAIESITFNATGTQATISWMPFLSSSNDTLWLGNQFLFADSDVGASVTVTSTPFQELNLSLHDQAGDILFTGPGSVNYDAAIHDWTVDAVTAPEPATLSLGGMALVGLALMRRRKRGNIR